MALPTSFKRAKSRGKTGSSRTSSLMRLAMDSTHTPKFTRAAPKNTFRNRQVNVTTRRPMGRALSTIRRGWARKMSTTVRSALGWHHRASSVMQPDRATMAASVAQRGSRALGRACEAFKTSFLSCVGCKAFGKTAGQKPVKNIGYYTFFLKKCKGRAKTAPAKARKLPNETKRSAA